MVSLKKEGQLLMKKILLIATGGTIASVEKVLDFIKKHIKG